jgi:hypothetical protein
MWRPSLFFVSPGLSTISFALKSRCVPGDAKASAGSGGVANGCTTGWVCLTNTSCVDGQVRKSPRHDRPHNSWHQANRCAQCGKSARWVRCGGGWKRIHGLAIEALPTETGSNKLGQTFGTPRQSSTRPASRQPLSGTRAPSYGGPARRHLGAPICPSDRRSLFDSEQPFP